jgi:hypothetical protein
MSGANSHHSIRLLDIFDYSDEVSVLSTYQTFLCHSLADNSRKMIPSSHISCSADVFNHKTRFSSEGNVYEME